MKIFIKRFFLRIVNVLFPVKCFVCGIYLDEEDEVSVCKHCVNEVFLDANMPRCSYCGNPLENELCFSCVRFRNEVNETEFSFYNRGVGRKLIYASKFDARKELVNIISEIVFETKKDLFFWAEAYLVIGNSKASSKNRGYCFVTEVTKKIAKKTKKPLLYPIIKKEEGIRIAQHFLSAKERKERVKDYFIFKGDRNLVSKKRLLVIDDITTTGATMQAFTAELGKHLKDVEIRTFSFSKTPYEVSNG